MTEALSLEQRDFERRDGWYPNEADLTPQLVGSPSFGQLFATQLNGQIYAQPLLVGKVLLVATETDWIYGLNPVSGAIEWSRQIGTPFLDKSLGCADLTPDLGVTSTPAVDPTTGVVYMVDQAFAGKPRHIGWFMAINPETGAEMPHFPVEIKGPASNNPNQPFTPIKELQRPGLLFLGGVVYAACVLSAELWGLPLSGLETAAYLLVIFSVAVIILRSDCGVLGQVFHASYLAAGFTFLGFAGYVAAAATHSIPEAITSSFLLLLDLGAFLVWGSNVSYVSDVLCRTRHSRPQPVADPGYQPMVSLHIPAYNEPPDLLINTIKAAEQLDYPDFEVVVIDNNTSDPLVYEPVEEYCRDRERVKFVHVAPWPGYKAGACNLALRSYTDPRAEIVGLIDADDIVQPYYLRETVS
jgi:hypothetical protein